MRELTLLLLWAVVFSIPFEQFTIESIGSITRLLGLAAFGFGVLSCVAVGRFRRPGGIVILSAIFVAQALSSLAWTLSPGASIERGRTYLQLLGLVWLIWEFARTRERFEPLIVAYCLGAYVAIGSLLLNFVAGITYFQVGRELRYSANGLDPNDLGLTLALAIPMAWYLFLTRRHRFLALAGYWYAPLAGVGILLTGSRGASLAGLVAASVIPLTSVRKSRLMATVIVLLIALGGATMIVPQYSLDRVSTAVTDARNLDMSGRGQIWAAGLRVFLQHALLGVGTGAFGTAVESVFGPGQSPHNTFLAILVEQGIIGFGCFTLLVSAWIAAVYRLPSQERKVWLVLIATWALGSMSLNWEYRKNVWLLFGLAAVHAARQHMTGREPVQLLTESASRSSRTTPGNAEVVDTIGTA